MMIYQFYNECFIRISSELIEQNICWKSKYLKTLIEVAFEEADRGESFNVPNYKFSVKPKVETNESMEYRQGLKWLAKHGLVNVERSKYNRSVYLVSLTDYAKKFITIEAE